MLRLTNDHVTVEPAGPILKAADFSALAEARTILEKAAAEAATITARAADELAAEKKRGYDAGYAEARQAAAEDVFERVERGINFYQHLQENIGELVTSAVEAIVGQCDHEQLLRTNLARVLKLARGQTFLTLKVSPAQTAQVQAQMNEILARSPVLEHLEVKADPTVSPGGCILVSEVGVVDATLDTQLEAVRQAIRRASG
jgi:type III secretion protein L